MNVHKKILPVIGLLSAYVHWIKPRLLPATAASKGGKSLLLHLCARSRILIPMIVFTAFFIFDAQMQIGVSISLTLSRNMRITLGTEDNEQPEAEPDIEDEDDGSGDDETYSIDTYSEDSFDSDVSFFVLDDVEAALEEFARNGTTEAFFIGNAEDASDE